MRSRMGVFARLLGRSLARHRLSTGVTALSAALACGLVMAAFSLRARAEAAFSGRNLGFDAVLGARGSEAQLVLNAVFHLETSPGNVPWTLVREVLSDPRVASGVPLAVGDSFRGYRVVGATAELFTSFPYFGREPLSIEAGGRPFDEGRREAVVGCEAASRLSLRPGSRFRPSHGVAGHEAHLEEHEEEYVVAGVLEPTGSPVDRVIWIPIEGMMRMSGHVLRGSGEHYTPRAGEEIPEHHREASAILLDLVDPQAGFELSRELELERRIATLAWPVGQSVAELFRKLGFVGRILEGMAFLVMAVAASAILAGLYNTMNERRPELALLRLLGARRRTVFALVLAESGAIAAVGAVGGYLVYAALHLAIGEAVRARTGVSIALDSPDPIFVLAPLAMLALGILAGVLPALRAYSVEVVEDLR